MFENKEELKNKIIYRASYRGSKEMDILMTDFVKFLINDLNFTELKELDFLVNLDDESLINIKNNILDDKISMTNLIKNFQEF
jgi:antitoxin CptB|tara:strand:- start:52 stop:300 length:249 start_codon:yes stop_codon:yes gene_type:complete